MKTKINLKASTKTNNISLKNLKNFKIIRNFSEINTRKFLKTFSFGLFMGYLFQKRDSFFSTKKIFCEKKENNFSEINDSTNNRPFDSNRNFEEKFIDFGMNKNNIDNNNEENSVFFIIYSKENSLQVELKEIILEKINFYLNEKNKNIRNNIKIKLIETSEKEKLNSLKESGLDYFDINFENSENFVEFKRIKKEGFKEKEKEIGKGDLDENNHNNKENYISEKLKNLQISNEPIILIKSGLCLENINALSFTQNDKLDYNSITTLDSDSKTDTDSEKNTKAKFNILNDKRKNIPFALKEKLNNLLLFYYCDDMMEIKEHFKYLENPEHKVILVSNELFLGEKNTNKNKYDSEYEKLNYDKIAALSLFKSKKTKIIFINNDKIKEKFNLKSDNIYIYYPPKLPYAMKNVELFMQENNLKQKYEGIDMNKLFNISPINFAIKFNFFRDEIKINYNDLLKNLYINTKEKYENNNNNKTLNKLPLDLINFSKFNFNKNDRQKLQKLFTYPIRQVRQLANCDKSSFKENWNKYNDNNRQNKNTLFVYLPTWAFLKENIFNFILYEANHLFDEIQITTSKNFTKKNNLYDTTQISDDLPQIFLINTNNSNSISSKKIYSFSYFKFSNELQNHLSNKLPLYTRSTSVENLTNVTFVNSKNFKEKILDDKNLKEFIIEVEHEGCPSCFMLGKMIDHLSLKLKKHKLQNKIKFFRIDTENDLRFLGDFAATPTYLFCKKNSKGEITFMNEIPKPEFIYRIKKYSNYDLNRIRYHPNLYFGFQVYQNKMFLKPDFDPDMDIKDYA